MVAALPLGYLVVRVAGAGDRVAAVLGRERTWLLAANSLVLVLLVAAGSLVLGTATGWLLTRVRLPAPRLWWVLAALPLAVPSYLLAFAVVATWPGTNGLLPLTAVLVLACTPYVTLPAAAAFRMADAGQEDVARTLGRGPVATFRAVTLPQVLPAALAGTLLVALYTLSDFGAVALLRYDVFTWAIRAAYEGTFDRSAAAVLALVLVALTLALVGAERWARRRWVRGRTGVAVRAVPQVVLGRGATAAAVLGLAAVAAASLAFPLAVLAGRLVQGTRGGVDVPDLLRAAGSTLALGLGGAVLAVALAAPVAVLAARHHGRLVAALESTAYLGHGLPGIVVGLSLVFFSLAAVPALYQSAAVLVLAYAVLFLPKAIGASRAAVERVPPAVEEVARTLGRGAARTWLVVTARQAWPGIAAGGLLVMVTAMKELPATLMLRPTGVDTLATELWRQTALGAYGAAAPAALLLVLMACVPAALLARDPGAGR
ncbi:ABC transporter permease [Pseudonocardia humida]|uniref:ABC transporter permease n=1 Tax=Pseudonocardia humida TaxID=2800819 RepID=UPI00207CA4A8|nr:ABC transporter permease subunit [Pseudonocardia humida]